MGDVVSIAEDPIAVATFDFPLVGPSVAPDDTLDANLLATINVAAMAPSIESRTGDVILKLRVVSADKYAALPLTEVLGRKLTLAIYGPRATQKHLGVGLERSSAARDKVTARRRRRGWEAEMQTWLEDDPDWHVHEERIDP